MFIIFSFIILIFIIIIIPSASASPSSSSNCETTKACQVLVHLHDPGGQSALPKCKSASRPSIHHPGQGRIDVRSQDIGNRIGSLFHDTPHLLGGGWNMDEAVVPTSYDHHMPGIPKMDGLLLITIYYYKPVTKRWKGQRQVKHARYQGLSFQHLQLNTMDSHRSK